MLFSRKTEYYICILCPFRSTVSIQLNIITIKESSYKRKQQQTRKHHTDLPFCFFYMYFILFRVFVAVNIAASAVAVTASQFAVTYRRLLPCCALHFILFAHKTNRLYRTHRFYWLEQKKIANWRSL